jgi:hypothetical protein
MTLSSSDLVTAGVVLLLLVTVAYGGTFVLRVSTGRQPANGFRRRSSAPATRTRGC